MNTARVTTGQIAGELHRLRNRADCARRQVAAVLVRDGMIVGRGRNRLPVGSCSGGDCPRGLLSYEQQPKDVGYASTGCRAVHAEVAAIRDAGLLALGSIVYVTEDPCPGCAAALDEAGVAQVVVVRLEHPVYQRFRAESGAAGVLAPPAPAP